MSNQAAELALLQSATVKHKAEKPKHGKINSFGTMDIAWTGGNPYDNTITSPAANGCYCPIELDKARRLKTSVYNPCQRPGGLSH